MVTRRVRGARGKQSGRQVRTRISTLRRLPRSIVVYRRPYCILVPKTKGMYLGSPCEFTCNPRLHHVYCDPSTGTCACDAKHPVQLGPAKGCAKPKKLGEQCFYQQTCRATDPHAYCAQVNHNAFCQCDKGYHTTSHSRPTQRVFCTEDLVLLTADMPTLLGVASGIFVLAGLLCMVLHLYTRARHHPTHLADARLTPPCLYSLNDTGGTMSATRPSSRSSTRSAATGGTLDSGDVEWRRARRGVPVSASRAGAARNAAILLISRHLRAARPHREGGAHPLKCAAKGETDHVCGAAPPPPRRVVTHARATGDRGPSPRPRTHILCTCAGRRGAAWRAPSESDRCCVLCVGRARRAL
ncbi:hypothetical protein EVAR_30117_1 [Eumeta japonica]|uniref:EB domain-containing protein n=1 Tax=Eumeta variegata TaxID=151549 RepID=A0A4C1WJ99_EUMVA|nr:hypothetical protein EVAR_30117_1 [Eumeta japonica]